MTFSFTDSSIAARRRANKREQSTPVSLPMAPILRPLNKDGKRYVVDSDDDETKSHPALTATTRDGAPSPTPGPRRTPARSSVKRERSPSASTIPPATTPRLQAPPNSSSTQPTTSTFAPPSSSRAEAMAAKARQEKLLAAAQLQQKLRTVPTSSTSSNETGPSRPPKPSTTVKRLATTNAVASSSRRPSSAQPVASSTVSLEGVYEKRPTLETDGSCIKVEGSNVARFDVDQAWQAFGQFGSISTLMEFVTPKTDNTKLVFVTYVDISSANRAIQKMSVDSFPIGQPAIALWTNLSNGKPRLSANRVKTQTFDAKVEKWLKGGVIKHSMTGPVSAPLTQIQDDMPSDDDSSEPDSERPPPPKKLKEKRARVETSFDTAPLTRVRPTSVRPPVKVRKEDVIELLSSDDVMGLGDEMGMDEDSASGSDIEVDVPPPPPYQKRTARAPVKRTPVPPVVAQPADDSSDSDMDDSDDEPRQSLSQLFPDVTHAVKAASIAVPPKKGATQQPTPEPEDPSTTNAESSSGGESSSSDSDDKDESDESNESTDEDSDDGGSGSNNANVGPANVSANVAANTPVLSRSAQKRAKQAALKLARAPKRKLKLERRLAFLTKNLPFPCPWCSQKFGLWSAFLAHGDAEHPSKGARCFQCPRRLATKSELKKHIQHHLIAQDRNRRKKTKKWWCKDCGGLFRTHLQKHVQKHQWEKSEKLTRAELGKM